jgi:DNA-binding winged helix-turn-helix (wHTH) protein
MFAVSETQNLLRFGVFELNVTTEELRKSGTLVRLAPQPLKLLALLARRSGQVVTREEIQQALWGGETYVDFEQGMNHCIKQIRNALSDSAETPLYVETVPRRGYRFLAPVVTKTIPAPPPRVIESQSGIQGSVPAQRPGAVGPAQPVVTDPTAVLRTAAPPGAQPVPEVPALAQPTPATGSDRWKLITIVTVLLILALAVALYLRSRRAARLDHKGATLAAHVEKITSPDDLPLDVCKDLGLRGV